MPAPNGEGSSRAVTLEIRPFEPGDAAAVWTLHNEALEATGTHFGNGPWDDDVRDPSGEYQDRGGEFLVGVLAGEIVAMGALRPAVDRAAEIKRMRVSPKHQRKGIGSRILAALESRAVELAVERLHLDTTEQQTAAQQLYLKRGYIEVDRRATGAFLFIFYEKRLQA